MTENIQAFLKNIWPDFHKHRPSVHLNSFHTFTNYWRLWTLSILILAVTALSPLCIVTLINYQLIQQSVDTELNLRAERLTATDRKSVV